MNTINDETEGPGLLASPWFWFGGIASLAVWAAVIWIVLR